MFVGRKADLQFLEEQYRSTEFSFVPIYGRRRIGKTTLIREFIKEKPAIYFQAFEERAQLNLERFSAAINHQIYGKRGSRMTPYASIADLLESLTEELKESDEKLVLIIDEYPYLAKVLPEVSSILQYYIDHFWKDMGNFQLILCGSSMSFMKRQVLGYQAPLYGRKTGQIQLKAFTIQETANYFPEAKAEMVLALHGLSGGVPQYLAQFDPTKPVYEIIEKNFLNTNSMLFEEPQNLLKQELEDPTNYNSILRAVAEGSSRLNQISTMTKIPTSNLSKYMENLMDLDLVEKKVPSGEENSKKTVYQIKDTMFRFWFRFIATHLSEIEIGMTMQISSIISARFNDFLGPIFEDICIFYLYQKMAVDHIPYVGKLASWWGNDPAERKQVEIDILGREGQRVLLAECKWRNQMTDRAIVEGLLDKKRLFFGEQFQLFVFSKTDFTKGARELAETSGVQLITFAKMAEELNLSNKEGSVT